MTLTRGPVAILGAGPTGALLAILLESRGFEVTLYDARTDPRAVSGESGRSINLALADRGIHALKLAGVYAQVAPTLVAMRGRSIHPQNGGESFQRYGQRPNEIIYSISRHRLNQALLEVALGERGIQARFEHRLQDIDFATGMAKMQDLRQERLLNIPMRPLLAADGAGSRVRQRMVHAGLIDVTEAELAHGYKELSIPADSSGKPPMAHDALHIWPRGNFMLIALPNADASFTATLFLAKHGLVSFDSLSSADAIERFFRAHFPDAYARMPECVAEFKAHPTGSLGTVYAQPWHSKGTVALIGDAAHAIVPFHGQGMNCCFEDCVEFAACVDSNDTWEAVFADFFTARKPNTDAIAAMALDNYLEMRERVIDPTFQLQQMLALELERRHPDRFIPRYSMVMFHHEIAYGTAQSRGLLQARLLSDLTTAATGLQDIDYARADREIDRTLARIC